MDNGKENKGLRVLSLFDGMACGRIALDRAGLPIEEYFASEIDKFAIKVSSLNYPDIKHLGDIRDVTGEGLGEIDLLIGGSPCTGFSSAGSKLNFDDPQSRLFFDYVRILRTVKPKWFLLENVRMKQEHQDVITEMLGVEPIMINSKLVSAQNRVRLYWTNIPGVTQPEDKGIKLQSIVDHGEVDREKSYCIDANYFKGVNPEIYWKTSRRQIVFADSETTEGYKDFYWKEMDRTVRWRLLTPTECERLQTVPLGFTAVGGTSNTQRYKMLGNGWTVDVIAGILENIKKNG